jgi:hypothetical protein
MMDFELIKVGRQVGGRLLPKVNGKRFWREVD